MTDFSLLPALIIYIVGILYTSASLSSILRTRTGFLKTDLGVWATRLLVTLIIGPFGIAIGIIGYVFYRHWFEIATFPMPAFAAYRFLVAVVLAVNNFQIAMERFWLICKDEKVPKIISISIMGHAIVTMGLIVGCFFSTETLITRRPGGTWQPYVVLFGILQYIILSFGGVMVLYTKTYLHVCRTTKEFENVDVRHDMNSSGLRLRVLKTCIMMTGVIFACYGVEAALVIYSLVTPDWKPPTWLDALSATMIALDSILSPMLVMEMHSSFVLSKSIAGSILRATQISEVTRDSATNPPLRPSQVSVYRKNLASITSSLDSKG